MFVPAKQLGQLDSLHRKHYASSKLFNTQAGAIAGREDQRHQYDEKYPYFVTQRMMAPYKLNAKACTTTSNVGPSKGVRCVVN